MSKKNDNTKILPSDVAKYFLLKTTEDGELISPLKMQKLVYYAYAWYMANKKEQLFDERIEAWANGPVVRSLYRELKIYGSSPINAEEYTQIKTLGEAKTFIESFPAGTVEILDEVYAKYQTMTAFELVTLTHQEKPWSEARKGLAPDQNSENRILDQHILDQYVPSK